MSTSLSDFAAITNHVIEFPGGKISGWPEIGITAVLLATAVLVLRSRTVDAKIGPVAFKAND